MTIFKNKTLFIIITIISLLFPNYTIAQEENITPKKQFSQIFKQLRARTEVPLTFPSFLPKYDHPLYSQIEATTAEFYAINLNDQKNCRKSQYIQDCNIIMLSAAIKDFESVSLESKKQNLQDLENKSVEDITLGANQNIEGILSSTNCSNNNICERRLITFDQRGIRYHVNVTNSDREKVSKIANSWAKAPLTIDNFKN